MFRSIFSVDFLVAVAVLAGARLPLAHGVAFVEPSVQDSGDAAPQELPAVRVEADGTVIDRSCRLVFGADPVLDADGDGVVRIVGDDVIVTCEGTLVGAPEDARPDAYRGTGIVVVGRNVRLVAPRVRGFKVGVHVDGAFATHIEDADVSDNFRQHLGSTWEREDPADWLWPHANDEHQWIENYGAGIWVDDARDTHLIRVFARDVQNGIVLDRATRARVRACDCSYLSGWGCALWRSTDCAITGNHFDHCIRGYAHGRYNRGQDSAGVLMFEQCTGNRVIANSITHGGDGVFAFAGKEALGEVEPPPAPDGEPFDHVEVGCNENVFRFNDLSFAAAHGLELTFSFGNLIENNLFEGNAICGAWLGYSRDTAIRLNRFVDNGRDGYGSERGAINAEHGQRLSVTDNVFEDNAVDVRLWTDADTALAATPWVEANGRGARDNWIVGNRHAGEAPLELVETLRTATDVPRDRMEADEVSADGVRPMRSAADSGTADRAAAITVDGLTAMRAHVLRRIGLEPHGDARDARGRATIVVGPWGPYDWSAPYLQPLERGGAFDRYRLLGPAGTELVDVEVVAGAVDVAIERATAEGGVGPDGLAAAVVVVRPRDGRTSATYRARVTILDGGETRAIEIDGSLVALAWRTRFAAYERDPREEGSDLDARLDAATALEVDGLDLDFAAGGPIDALAAAGIERGDLEARGVLAELESIGTDRFGTRATCEVELEAGRWRVRTVSDDGVRARLDGRLVIDDWTWHAATEHVHTFTVERTRRVEIAVEHFELDGWAQLTVELVPAIE